MLGIFVGLVARLWLATLRVEIHGEAALRGADGRPWILCFFHGTQFSLLAWPRRRKTVALVSHSSDGVLHASALRFQGFEVVHGSSSRGGARGLAAVIRRLRQGRDAAFAVDGPRGPYGVVKAGALAAARASGGLLVPMGSSARHAWVARHAWDRFTLPYPFTRIVVTFGSPIDPGVSGARDFLEREVRRLNEEARRLLLTGEFQTPSS